MVRPGGSNARKIKDLATDRRKHDVRLAVMRSQLAIVEDMLRRADEVTENCNDERSNIHRYLYLKERCDDL